MRGRFQFFPLIVRSIFMKCLFYSLNKYLFSAILVGLLFAGKSFGQSYPDMPNVSKPSPEPAFPSGFDSFLPPVNTAAPVAGAPAIAEWTRIGSPDAVIAMTGSQFSSYTSSNAGKDTQFMVFGQTGSGSVLGAASILRLDGL